MADNLIKVKAYGKVLNFPAGTPPEAIEQALAEHEPILNPEYKPPEPEALDYAKGFASGANKLVSGVGFLAEAAGAKETGKAIREFGDRGAKYWNDKMSAGGKLASKSQVFVDDDNEESITGIKLSDDWGKALLMSASQSLPSMFAAAIPGVAVTKGIQALAKLGLAGGAGATIPLLAGTAAPVGVTSNIIARVPSAIGFGASEGVVAGAMNASEFKASIEGMTDEELSKSPVYRALKTEHDPETARSMLAEQAALDLFGKTAVSTGVIGAVTGGGALSQAYQKVTSGAKTGLLGTVIKGAGSEALQEGPQSGGEQYLQNLTTKEFLDPSKDTTEGVATAAASGAVVGGFMGGVVGGGSSINITPDRRAQVLNEKRRLAEMKASTINARQQEANMADISAAQDIDQAIIAAHNTTKSTATPDDVLRTEDPTLADIERLTGLTPTEAINTAIGEINNPQPQEELKNDSKQTTQQETTTQAPVLNDGAGKKTEDVSIASLQSGKTSASWVVREKQSGKVLFETFDKKKVDNLNTDKYEVVPAYKYLTELNSKISGTKPPEGALTQASPVLNAEEFKASGSKQTHEQYLRSHPNRKQAAVIDGRNVENNLIKSLQKTGKFTVADSKTYAKPFSEFYRVNAERQGILPSELYERMPLNFKGNGKESPKVELKQGEKIPTIKVKGIERPTIDSDNRVISNPEKFHEWFGDSKVTDDEGRPLTVYHGTGRDFSEFSADKGEGARYKTGVFFSDSPEVASTYATGENKNVMKSYVSLKNPVVVDVKGSNWNRLGPSVSIELPNETVADKDEELLASLGDRAPNKNAERKLKARKTSLKGLFPNDMKYRDDTMSTNDIVRWAREQGYEGVVIKNVVDSGPAGVFHNEKSGEPHNSFVVFDPTKIKSATGNNGEFNPKDPNILKQSEKQTAKLDLSNQQKFKDFKHEDTTISYGKENGGLKIYSMRTPVAKRNKGSARRAMTEFLGQADANRLDVTLDSSPLDARTKDKRLFDFYKSLGFEPTGKTINAVGDPEMVRRAKRDSGILKQSKKVPEGSLVAQHNITMRGILHADRMGGLAVPSLAVADKDKPLTGFGEITLIASSNMVDPKRGAKVFGADIYSPRYPSVTLVFDRKSVDRLNEKLKPFTEAVNSNPIGFYELNNAGSSREVARIFKQEPAVLAAFLTEKGIAPKYKEKPKVAIAKELKPFTGATDAQALVANPNFLKAVGRLHKEFLDEKNNGDFTQSDKDRFLRNLAYDDAHRVVAYSKYIEGKGKIDPNASFASMRLQIDAKKLTDELEVYAEGLINQMRPEEKLFKGFTYSGSRRYSAHTLENVVNELKKNLRGGETFNYGLGTVRSKYTPQFKSLDQIRKEKGRLVSDEEFNSIRKEVDDKFFKLGEKLDQYHEAARFDTFAQAAYDSATTGIPRALKENGYKDVPPELMEEVRDFLADLAHMPTEYFEVKLSRIVDLSEFSAAVVPKHTPQSVLDVLKKNGITDIKKYKDAEDRKKQIGSFEDLLFQSNFYSALEKEIGNLKKIANKDGMVSVEQAKAWINSRQKEGKFKQAEVEAVGLMDWLDTLEGKVPVADVENFVQENGVQVEEVVLEGSSEPDIDEDRVFDIARERFDADYEPAGEEADDAAAEIVSQMMDDVDDPHWDSLIGVEGAEDVKRFLEDEEIDNTRDLQRYLNARFTTEEILGQDDFYQILDDAQERAWEDNGYRYLDEAREELANEAGSGSGGTEFGDYVLRGGEEGYKELLLTLPKSKAKFNAPHFDNAQENGAENIFAHTRINERYVDAPMTDEELAQKAAYDEWVKGNKSPEILELLDAKREASENYHRAIITYRTKVEEDKSLSGGERVRLLRDMYDGDNPPADLEPFIKRIDEIGEKVKAKQEERLAVKPPEPVKSSNKERVLFVEEIQSDWAQKGRDEGFAALTSEERKELSELDEKARELGNKRSKLLLEGDEAQEQRVAINLELLETNKRREEIRSKVRGRVPTAPFVTDTKAWTGLVAKRLLRYAAENGFDRIAWTAGAQQAERYRLDRFISEVTAKRVKDLYQVNAVSEDGRTVFDNLLAEEDLAGTLGAELAEKIKAQPEGVATYTGLELRSGGEGMREFYDRIVPSVFNDVSRKLGGGKVETISMGPQSGKIVKGLEGRIVIAYPNGSYLKNRDTGVMTESQDRADRFDSYEEASKFLDKFEAQNLHEVGRQMSLAITPALKEKVMQGLPLFQRDRAGYNPNTFTISLMDGSDMSSVIHEGAHFYLEALHQMASRPDAPRQIVKDFDTTLDWFGVKKDDWETMSLDQKRPYHEQWAQSFELYAMEGVAPTEEMQPVFERFKQWMLETYKSLKEFLKNNPLAGKLNNDVRQVFDRLLASDADIAATAAVRGSLKQTGKQKTKAAGTTPPSEGKPAAASAAKKPFNPNEDIPETRFRKAQRLSQDAFNRFTVINEWLKKKGVTLSEKADVFQAEERYHSLVANQLEDFREQQRNPLIEKISKAGFTLDDVADFLEAQHAEEANKAIQDVRSDPMATAYGITDAEAKAYLAKADPKLAKLANELRDITEQSKQMRLKAGLISQDEVDAWEAAYQHYIPVKGDADAKGGTGKGLKVNFKSKRRLGHGRRDEAVIENIFMDHERAIMQVEKNRVAKHLVMMAAEMNMPEIVSIGQPVKRNTLRTKTAYEVQVNGLTRSIFSNKQAADMFKQLLPSIDKSVQAGTITINPTSDSRVIAMASPMLAENEINAYIDGHAIRVQINDDLLARAYGKLGVTGFSALVSAGRAFNGYLSKVYTGYNPEFILTNMIRDFTSGLINLSGEEGGKIALKASANYLKSFSSLMKYAISNGKKSDKWIDMYRANGGNTGAAYLSDLERLGDEVKTEYASYQGVLKNLKSGDIANASRAAGRKAFNVTLKWIYNLNQAGENAMRLSAFRAMIESGKTPNQAAKAAKNITVNFNRKGELGAEANAAYLFFNASVQGTAALAHAHFKGKHRFQAWGLSSMVGVLGYLAAMALIGDDEDDYDKINDYTKSRNFMIKAGDGYAQIPVPYGYGFFWNTGRAIAEAQHKGELGKLPWHMAASAIEELTPFSDTVVGSQDGFQFDQVLLGMLPTVIKIPAQPAFNKQLFSGGEMFPERASQQFQPDREKMWRSTQGTMYDKLAGWLSDAGLGDVSPETLKHYTRTATGGTGALVDATVSAAMLKKEGAELEPSEIPFFRKAYSKLTIREQRAAYYTAREEAKKTAEAFSRAKTKNDVTTIDKIIKDEGEMIGLDAYANSLSEAIGAVRDLQDAIRLDEGLNAAEKRVQIKELEITEGKFYDQYLDAFKTEKLKMRERKN